MNKSRTPILLFLSLVAVTATGPQLFAQPSKLKVNNEKPQTRNQVKRMHPHAFKLILQGKKKEAIAYLEAVSEKEVNPGHNKMLLDLPAESRMPGSSMPRPGLLSGPCPTLP